MTSSGVNLYYSLPTAGNRSPQGAEFEQAELKLIVVLRKETNRFDKTRNDSIR